jgi:hypothetical protein
MRLDALLRAHGFMRVERPPQLWEADTDDERFIPLLGEMIAASLARGAKLEALTLNVANVTVPEPEGEDGDGPAAGDYVAVTVRGELAWEAEAAWTPGRPWTLRWLDDLTQRLAPAGVRFGYTRNLQPGGSITVFLPRLVELPNAGPGADSGSGAQAPRRARRA